MKSFQVVFWLRLGAGWIPEDVSPRLIGNRVAEICQGSDDAVVSPAGVLSGEAHNERFQFGCDPGPAWSGAEFRTVKLAGNEATVPGEDGVGFSDTGDRSFEHASLVDAAAGRNCHVRSQSLA